MSALLLSLPLLWAQAPGAGCRRGPPRCRFRRETLVPADVVYPLERPDASRRDDLIGGVLTWLKAMSLVCLVCWVARLAAHRRQAADRRHGAAGSTISGVAALILTPVDRHDPGARVGQADARLLDRLGLRSARCWFVPCVVLLRDLGRGRTRPDDPATRPGTRLRWFISGSIWRWRLGVAVGFVPPAERAFCASSCESSPRCRSRRSSAGATGWSTACGSA